MNETTINKKEENLFLDYLVREIPLDEYDCFYATQKKIYKETGLSPYKQRKIFENLKKEKIVSKLTKKEGYAKRGYRMHPFYTFENKNY